MRIVTLESVGSTNDEVVARAEAGERLPLAVRAIEQHAGRGRLGRDWASPKGGVWMSLADRWTGVIPGAVALRAALAVHACVEAELNAAEVDRLRIKWPNDLLLDGKKIAGVLCERRVLSDESGDGSTCLLVIGVGINADFDADRLPRGVRTPATTLRSALGRSVCVETLAARLTERLEVVLAAGPAPLDDREIRGVVDRLAYWGERVRVAHLDGTALEGVLAELAPDGRVAIRAESGIAWVSAGDVERAARA